MELLLRAGSRAAVFGINQRKAFAVKIVLGLMLSMDSDGIVVTWDPKRLHSFQPHENKFEVFVSIRQNKDTSGPKALSLVKLDIPNNLGLDDDDDDDVQPIPVFMRLAKLLLQIACGERLRKLEVTCHPERELRATWKRHRRLVEDYMRTVTSGDGVDLGILPFLRAAQNCLDFHLLYQKHAMTSQPSSPIEAGWNLVFRAILSQIDDRLSLGGSDQPGTSGQTDGDAMLVESQVVAEEISDVTMLTPTKVPSVTSTILQPSKGKFPSLGAGPVTSRHDVVLFDGEDVMEGSK